MQTNRIKAKNRISCKKNRFILQGILSFYGIYFKVSINPSRWHFGGATDSKVTFRSEKRELIYM